MSKHLYILVADGSRAKIYQAEHPVQSLELIYDQINFIGRKKNAEIDSDRAGTQRNSTMGSHSFAGDRDSHDHEEDEFARDLCRIVCDAHRAGKFDGLVLIAPPRFLGVLRQHLDKGCRDVLLKTVDKDLVKMADPEIIEYIA